MKPRKIRLFVKPYCPWCVQAIAWLDQRQINYEYVDVVSSAPAFKEMIDLSGQSLAPVIQVDGQVLADFDTGQLESWWGKQGFNA